MPVDTRKNNIKKFFYTIRDTKNIHKYDLIDALHISESTYEKLKPYMEYRFGNELFYEKATKCWIWVKEDENTEKVSV